MNIKWDKFGARLGIGVCLAGFALIFFGWNGAASVDRVPSQFPYLISGGLAGLALVIVGAALIVVETSRDGRERLREELAELRQAIDRLANPATSAERAREDAASGARGEFVAGERSYHRPGCRLLEGRGELPRVTAALAAKRGLAACRVCEPSRMAGPAAVRPQTRKARAGRKAPRSRR